MLSSLRDLHRVSCVTVASVPFTNPHWIVKCPSYA